MREDRSSRLCLRRGGTPPGGGACHRGEGETIAFDTLGLAGEADVRMTPVRLARCAIVLGIAVALHPQTARAGIRPFIWTWDTQILAPGDVELEQWLWAKTRAPAAPGVPGTYWIWWGPVIGLTEHL